MEQKKFFKIFLSAPSDVKDDVVHAKNYINDTLKSHWKECVFEAFEFRDFPSQIENCSSQEVINSQIQSLGIDIYIGLMCGRFGTPTEKFGSGTQEEFETCLNKFKETGSPRISFLFKPVKTALEDSDADAIASWLKVKDFRDNRVGKTGLYQNYETNNDLEKKISNIISDFVKKMTQGERRLEFEANLPQSVEDDGYPKLRDKFFSEWLDSPGQALANGIKSIISLDEIYVNPRLVNETAMQPPKDEVEQVEKPIDFTGDWEKQAPFSIFVGGEGAGKTTILKKLFRSATSSKKVPVFLDFEDVAKSRFHDIPRLINKRFKEQYDAGNIDSYEKLSKDNKVVLIDNFDAISINRKGRIKLVNDLCDQCSGVFITVDSDFYGTQFDFSLLKHTNLNDCEIFEIQEFNRNQIQKLTTKWVRAGQEFDISEEEEQNKVEIYVSLLSDILGFNYVPKCPLVILVALLGLSGGEEVSELRHPSIARYYEFLITKHLFSAIPDKEVELAYSLFAFLAYRFYQNENEEIASVTTQQLLQEFSDSRDLPLADIESVFDSAVANGIISESSEGSKFKHNYAFYYFLAKYCSDRLSDTEIDEMVADLSDNLHLKRSASILVFLAYQNRHECIIKLLQKQLGETLNEVAEFDFDSKAASSLTNLRDVAPKIFLNDEDKVKQNIIQSEEESEKRLNEFEPEKDGGEGSQDDFALNFIVTIRRIEVSGQLLKCHAVNMTASTKYDLFENSINLGLRLLNELFTAVFDDPEDLVSYLHSRFKGEVDEEEIKRTVFLLASGILAFHMSLWSRYLGAGILEITSDKVAQENKGSIAHQLVKMAMNLDTKERLQDIGLDNVLKACGDNIIALTVLKMLVWRRLVMRPKDDRVELQSVCDKLDIAVKPRKRLLNK